jgi:hypothetical protein
MSDAGPKWLRAIAKGDELLQLMQLSIGEAATALGDQSESSFQNIDNLIAKGWTERILFSAVRSHTVHTLGLEDMFDKIGIEDDDCILIGSTPASKLAQYAQDQPSTKGGGEVEEVGGQYHILSHRKGFFGAFMNDSFYQPAVSINPKAATPHLFRWSDVGFVVWNSCEKKLKAPRYILRVALANATVREIIDHVLRDPKGCNRSGLEQSDDGFLKPRDWPGHRFDIDSDEGKILLGSPNGAGVAWFLTQHKKELGVHYVDRVTVFQSVGQYYMLFSIREVRD